MVNEQKFPSDLYYRPNVFSVRVPMLRERPEDSPLLVWHFVNHLSRRMHKRIDTIPSETIAALVRYPWPSNVRELQNVIDRAVIISNGPILKQAIEELHELPLSVESKEELPTHTEARPVCNCGDRSLRVDLKDAERQEIVAALEKTGGKLLSISEGGLDYLIANRQLPTRRIGGRVLTPEYVHGPIQTLY